MVAGFAACHTVLVEGKWVNYREQPPLLLPQHGITIGSLRHYHHHHHHHCTERKGKERGHKPLPSSSSGGTTAANRAKAKESNSTLGKLCARTGKQRNQSPDEVSFSLSLCVCVFARVPLHGCPSPLRSLGQSVSQTPQSPQSKPSSHLWAPSK